MPGYIQLRELLRKTLEDICFEVSKHRHTVPHAQFTDLVIRVCPDIRLDEMNRLLGTTLTDIDFDQFATMILKRSEGNSSKLIKEKGYPYLEEGYTFEEFVVVLKNIYPFIMDKLSEAKLRPLFRLIDLDNDGFVRQSELDSLFVYVSTPDRLEAENNSTEAEKLIFSNIRTAKHVRNNLMKMLVKFDKNKDFHFDQEEVACILRSVLYETEIEVEYTLPLIFGSKMQDRISYNDMANFLLERHCGQMSIQRIHSMSGYKNGGQRIMSYDQFLKTLDIALGYFYILVPKEQMRILFSQIDRDQNGFITFKEYFQFLSQFFGSKSVASTCQMRQNVLKINQEVALVLNHDSSLGDISSEDLLRQVFETTPEEAEFGNQNLFKLLIETQPVTQEEIKKMLSFLHMSITMLLKGHKTHAFKRWRNFLISSDQFFNLIKDATEWAEITSDTSVLSFVFTQLDTDKDKYITYKEYMDFIRQSGGHKTVRELDEYIISLFQDEESKPSSTSLLKLLIWRQLSQHYNQHLIEGKQMMDLEQTNCLVSEMVKQKLQEEEYVRWNYSRIDKNNDNMISSQQFISFLISHSAEIALQRYHMNQTKGKNSLNLAEFTNITMESFKYLPNTKGWSLLLRNIYDDIREEQLLSYKSFLVWVKNDLA